MPADQQRMEFSLHNAHIRARLHSHDHVLEKRCPKMRAPAVV